MADRRQHRARTGIAGLDDVLHGGIPAGSSCLLRGGPGAGKTTIGAHFVAEGRRTHERSLVITLGENRASLTKNAEAVGIDLHGVDFLDFSPSSGHFAQSDSSTLFSPNEPERDQVTKMVVQAMATVRPARVFLDSSSHLRMLAIDAVQYRKQLLSLVRYLLDFDSTLLLTSESSPEVPDHDARHLCDGVVNLYLEQAWRYLEVTKLRGSSFRTGRHTLRLGGTGCQVFPALRPQEHTVQFVPQLQASEIAQLDTMLCGGVERGTTTIITGPSGVGKTTLSLQFAQAAARRGDRAVIFSFEESCAAIAHRASSLGFALDVRRPTEKFEVKSIEPLLVTADEVAHMLREEVEVRGCKFLVLDSVTGYRLSIRSANFVVDLRSALKYLTNMGVTVLVINEVEALTGDFRVTDTGISFLADNLIFLRYLEMDGELRKAIGVLKKRLSDFERTLREFFIAKGGLRVGTPLTGLRRILSGTPEWTQQTSKLPATPLGR